MAYNRAKLLEKIIEIQNIVLTEKKRGLFQINIYHNLIAKQYFISESTFNNYLAINAKRELELLQSKAETKKAVSTLFWFQRLTC